MSRIIKYIITYLYTFLFIFFPNLNCNIFSLNSINPIIEHNRNILNQVKQWVTNENYYNSFFNFGLPAHVKEKIDLPMGNEVTYTDAMIHFSRLLKKKIKYLELGVSVGKNFFQVANSLYGATLVGFDLENINPTLKNFFSEWKFIEQWNTKENSIKLDCSSCYSAKYKFNNKIYYLSGDIFDEYSWFRLLGFKFNLIFSDAFHSPEALLHEFNMLQKYDLIDNDEFLMVWDDLGGTMTDSFYKIFKELKIKYQLSDDCCAIIPLRGWLGVHEFIHQIGFIINLK